MSSQKLHECEDTGESNEGEVLSKRISEHHLKTFQRIFFSFDLDLESESAYSLGESKLS